MVNLAYPPASTAFGPFELGIQDVDPALPQAGASPSRKSLLRSIKPYLHTTTVLKSEEALYVATYMAGQWKIPLVVLTVLDARVPVPPETLDRARQYLEQHGVQALLVAKYAPVAQTIHGSGG